MKNQRGTSLVSVIVSFAVMMIVLLLLQVSITAGGRYAARAKEVWRQAAEAENKYVNDELDTGVKKPSNYQIDLVMIPESGGEGEPWGMMEKRETIPEPDDPDGFKIYYFKHPSTP